MDSHFLKRVQIKNILSFDEEGIDLEMKPLNVLIGPNAVGKSNFISALEIMFSLPMSFQKQISQSGGAENILWKGSNDPEGRLSFTLGYLKTIVHTFKFNIFQDIIEETILPIDIKNRFTPLYFENLNYKARIAAKGKKGGKRDIINLDDPNDSFERESILSQRQDPTAYPEITSLRKDYDDNLFYGIFRYVDIIDLKEPNTINEDNNRLNRDNKNLSLVINRLDAKGILNDKILPKMKNLYNIVDIRTFVDGGKIWLEFKEKYINKPIPQSRISDGTIRFLRLLAILYNPNSPKVICLEEPENGLHPEVIPALADALIEASEDKQIIITTHSADLVSEFSSTPEYVVVCEREDAGTQMKRLNVEDIDLWLERYRLGKLWEKGVIGGTRY
jgi:predicted ATPase